MKTTKEENKKNKLGILPYIVAGLSYVPLMGVPFGIIAILWGIFSRKSDSTRLILIGIGGISFTTILYSALFYFGFVQRGGIYDEARLKLAEHNMNSLVQALEFYKAQHGEYPRSLEMLDESLSDNSRVFIFDPTDIRFNSEPRKFYYELVDDKSYYLLSVGLDGQPFTSDDILPNVDVLPDSNVGLIKKDKN